MKCCGCGPRSLPLKKALGRCSTRVGSSLQPYRQMFNYVAKFCRDKRSSLFRPFVSDKEKKFYNIDCWWLTSATVDRGISERRTSQFRETARPSTATAVIRCQCFNSFFLRLRGLLRCELLCLSLATIFSLVWHFRSPSEWSILGRGGSFPYPQMLDKARQREICSCPYLPM